MVRSFEQMNGANVALGVTLMVTGFVLSFLAKKNMVVNGDITWENLLQDALGFAISSAGAYKLFRGVEGLTKAQTFYASIGIGLVINALALGLAEGVKASRDGVNGDVLIGEATSAIEAGLGAFLLGRALADKVPALQALGAKTPAFAIGVAFVVSSLWLLMDSAITASQ